MKCRNCPGSEAQRNLADVPTVTIEKREEFNRAAPDSVDRKTFGSIETGTAGEPVKPGSLERAQVVDGESVSSGMSPNAFLDSFGARITTIKARDPGKPSRDCMVYPSRTNSLNDKSKKQDPELMSSPGNNQPVA